MAKEFYRGEAMLKSWSDSSRGGRTITLTIEDEGPHQFKGYEGERFAVVIMPIGNDEQPMEKAPAKERRHWKDMRPSARAAMLCDDPHFREFLGSYGPAILQSKEDADAHLKAMLSFVSKRELDATGPAREHFEDLEGTYRAWQQSRGHGAYQ